MKFIIKESKFKETIIDNIDKNGLLDTLTVTNMSFTKLFSMIGMDFLTNKVMINFIEKYHIFQNNMYMLMFIVEITIWVISKYIMKIYLMIY